MLLAYSDINNNNYYTDSLKTILLFSKDGRTLEVNEFLIGVIENFREDMLTGIPELKVPVLDPFKAKKPIKIDVEDKKASVHGNFSDILVNGKHNYCLKLSLLLF